MTDSTGHTTLDSATIAILTSPFDRSLRFEASVGAQAMRSRRANNRGRQANESIQGYFAPRMRSHPNLLRRLGLLQLKFLEALRRHLLQAAKGADAVIAIDHA